MFQRRLKWFAIAMTALALVIVGRLAQIQLVQAAQYEQLAERLLTRDVRYIRAARGDIVDRHGRLLVSDEPAWDLSVKYDIIAGRPEYLNSLAKQLRREGKYPSSTRLRDIVESLKLDVARMWQRLSELTGEPLASFVERGEQIIERVDRVRDSVERRTGIVRRLAEEEAFHPIFEGLDDDLVLRARLELESGFPWLAVVPGSRRVAHNADCLVHVLGRVGAVSRARMRNDPLQDDELRALRPVDDCGLSGVELTADTLLRGTRGRIVEDFGRIERERLEPVRGQTCRLTIDYDLQREAYAAVEEAVRGIDTPPGGNDGGSTGGAAVVIDTATREILALVSYPAYAYDRYRPDYDALQADMRWQPLRFRAVSEEYPPGSVCKAITLIGALNERLCTPETTYVCNGIFLPTQPNAFRCWIYNQRAGSTHGPLDAYGAIQHSCNIYFFKLGEKLGADRLCDWFSRFGLGCAAGTGLIEEAPGIVPHSRYLRRVRKREPEPADAWNFAIGQGEVTATPLQAANVSAAIATGQYRPAQLFVDTEPQRDRTAAQMIFDESSLKPLRIGMWRVVNDPSGTAFKYARLASNEHVLCGKTGSAQAMPRVLAYNFTFGWPDGTREVIHAVSEVEATRRLHEKYPQAFLDDGDTSDPAPDAVRTPPKRPRLLGRTAAERYPPWSADEKLPSHAWFMGWTQPANTPRGDKPRGKCYAIAVIIEYGGGGGREAGPVAKRIAQHLLGAGANSELEPVP